MFTGIIEDLGTVESVRPGAGGGKVLGLRTGFDPSTIKLGDSIAVNGVCLTVTSLNGARFTADAGHETLARTTLGRLVSGARVNLERALAVGDRLGGHLVHGHVDSVGRVRSCTKRDNAHDFVIEAPADLMPLIAPRGSIAIDGISLTVTGVEAGAFSVMIIPHTLANTTLGGRQSGDSVNLEADMLARYVARYLDAVGPKGAKPGYTEEQLRAKGF